MGVACDEVASEPKASGEGGRGAISRVTLARPQAREPRFRRKAKPGRSLPLPTPTLPEASQTSYFIPSINEDVAAKRRRFPGRATKAAQPRALSARRGSAASATGADIKIKSKIEKLKTIESPLVWSLF